MRYAGACILLALCLSAQAEMVTTSQSLVYAPNLLGQFVENAGAIKFGSALPEGSGTAIMAFAHLLGLIAVWKSCAMAYERTNVGSRQGGEGGWGGVILMFIAGVCVFHINRTMGTLAATIPGFPDLTPILSY